MRRHRCFSRPVRGSCMPVLYVRAILAVRRGNADEAIALLRESLTLIRALHDKFAFVYALVPLAAAAVLKGDDAWAARILGARDAVIERTGRHGCRCPGERPPGKGGTRCAGTPRPGSVGPCLCGRPPDLDRFGSGPLSIRD